jgi:diguanylate cyclase (GGDEF)-like protein
MEAGTVYRSTRATPDAGSSERGEWRRPVGRGEWSALAPGALEDVPREVPPERLGRFALWTLVGLAAALAVTAPVLVDLPAILRSADPALWLIAALAVLVDTRWFAGRQRFATVYPSVAFTFALLLGWGVAVAVPAQALAVLVASLGRRDPAWRLVFDQARYALSLAGAGGVLAVAGVPRIAGDVWATSGLWVSWAGRGAGAAVATVGAIVLAGVVWAAVNGLLAATASALAFDVGWVAELKRLGRQNGRVTLGLLALAPLVVAAGAVNPLLVLLGLVPLGVVGQHTRYTTEEARKAATDELTGLPNRKALYAHVQAQARTYGQFRRRRRGRPDERRMALLLLDIDQFRRVNEALGHGVGDRLLVAVAARLREAIGGDGLVTRLGGDEFAVLAPRLADSDAVGVLANRVADALADPVVLDGLPLDVTAAIGAAIYPDHGTDVITLLRRAEVAMYDAKDHSATWALYTPDAEQHSPERLELLADLRRALDAGSDELQLHYQPQIDLATGHVCGAESLLRWNHPQRGFISPDMIIRIAEHTAIMRRLTARVIEEAVSQLAKWRADGLQLRVSVNVSARDLHRGEFVDDLAELLAERGVPANQLQIEITEGALMADSRRVLLTLHRLDRLGVALSLDDFGTGYSSLTHLRRLPLAEVKIDKSFVLGMATDTDDNAIVGSIIDLGRRLGLRVVAEGVEDEETRRMLLAAGCEVGQGWYFARPMPADAFVSWLARYRPPGAPA